MLSIITSNQSFITVVRDTEKPLLFPKNSISVVPNGSIGLSFCSAYDIDIVHFQGTWADGIEADGEAVTDENYEDLLGSLYVEPGDISSINIRKTYLTYSSMIADENPIDDETGEPLRIGFLVHVNNDPEKERRAIYRYLGTGFEYVGKYETINNTYTNLPDDEDLTSAGLRIKFADRQYIPELFSGLGRKILRKNISSNKNILLQSAVNQSNTIYEIRYDFDLNGATINLPVNCILDFQGGSFKNGILIGNSSSVISIYNPFDSVELQGNWKDYGQYLQETDNFFDTI